jgi:hypothetical protein
MWFFLPISLDFSKITASLSVFLFSQEVKILRSFNGLSTEKLSPTTPLPCLYESTEVKFMSMNECEL